MSGDFRIQSRVIRDEHKENTSIWDVNQKNKRFINLTGLILPIVTLCSAVSPVIYFPIDGCSHRPMRITMIITNIASFFFCYIAFALSMKNHDTSSNEWSWRSSLAFSAALTVSMVATGGIVLTILMEIITLHQYQKC